jgi:hypothetical protein
MAAIMQHLSPDEQASHPAELAELAEEEAAAAAAEGEGEEGQAPPAAA